MNNYNYNNFKQELSHLKDGNINVKPERPMQQNYNSHLNHNRPICYPPVNFNQRPPPVGFSERNFHSNFRFASHFSNGTLPQNQMFTPPPPVSLMSNNNPNWSIVQTPPPMSLMSNDSPNWSSVQPPPPPPPPLPMPLMTNDNPNWSSVQPPPPPPLPMPLMTNDNPIWSSAQNFPPLPMYNPNRPPPTVHNSFELHRPPPPFPPLPGGCKSERSNSPCQINSIKTEPVEQDNGASNINRCNRNAEFLGATLNHLNPDLQRQSLNGITLPPVNEPPPPFMSYPLNSLVQNAIPSLNVPPPTPFGPPYPSTTPCDQTRIPVEKTQNLFIIENQQQIDKNPIKRERSESKYRRRSRSKDRRRSRPKDRRRSSSKDRRRSRSYSYDRDRSCIRRSKSSDRNDNRRSRHKRRNTSYRSSYSSRSTSSDSDCSLRKRSRENGRSSSLRSRSSSFQNSIECRNRNRDVEKKTDKKSNIDTYCEKDKSSNHSDSTYQKRSKSISKKLVRSSYHRRSHSFSDHKSDELKSSSNESSRSNSSERLSFIKKWRMNNCSSKREMEEKIDVLVSMDPDQIVEEEKKCWHRSAPADLYYQEEISLDRSCTVLKSTKRVHDLCEKFSSIINNFESIKAIKPPFDYTVNRSKIKVCCHGCSHGYSSDSSDSVEENEDLEENWMAELELKQKHPDRLHPELWFNDKGEMNDGPLCRCSNKSRRSGIRHNIYASEQIPLHCNPDTNNANNLFHYRITVTPPTNFLINKPTLIEHDGHEYLFEGFSLLSHYPLEKLPPCKVIRFNIQYTILYIEEKIPQNYTVREADLFFKYLFHEILELVDLDLKSENNKDGCPQFHIMPRFVREIEDNGKELLPMCKVVDYFVKSYIPVVPEELVKEKDKFSIYEWQDFADEVKGMIVTKPGSKPCALRVDQLDRENEDDKDNYPVIIHFGLRPPQLSYAGNPKYQKAWKSYVKLRHLLANKAKRSDEDKRKLASREMKLQEMRTNSKMKRGVTIAISSRNFFRTGIMCDMVQHAMLIPVLICHLRFHRSLDVLENRMNYIFKNRGILQLALTHPSYRENFGTNPDHARNSLTNCGIRQPEYGDRKIHFQNTRKRGINTLINIMSRLGKKSVTESNITHNERLEFLGDAVVEFITSIHLFHIFPNIEEGGLATYRAAIVQNQHLAVLAKNIGLEEFMLYAHGSDLCHELELKHAMANCYEALMGALYLDGGVQAADQVFSRVMYGTEEKEYKVWVEYPKHPLQEQEPGTDRHWIERSPILRTLTEFEDQIGVIFNHIRLLARVFTTRSMGYTYLTLGSNQRLEFLGDTVLQLITSDYLYSHFPEHHEGHLSLLRSSLVNNRTQSVVCDDIGMPEFANLINPKVDLKMKDRADLLEALLGAIYIDKGMVACEIFCKVCFFPRLQYFILNQEWNDPKSKLQQCCLTLRTLDGGEPDIPIYKVIECIGPTNNRIYTVAVYFQQERLASATGNSIQTAEMNAAKNALDKCPNLFPQLDHQKRVIAKSMILQKDLVDLV